MRIVNKHTASLTLPAAPGYPLGIDLVPGATEIPDGYMDIIGNNPTVHAWFTAGLIDVDGPVPEPEPEPLPLPPPAEEEPEPLPAARRRAR